jgi:hypothetical protein
MFTGNQRGENAPVVARMETDVQGGSTCRTKAITGEPCGHEFSASAVSDLDQKQRGQLPHSGRGGASFGAGTSATRADALAQPYANVAATGRRVCPARRPRAAAGHARCGKARADSSRGNRLRGRFIFSPWRLSATSPLKVFFAATPKGGNRFA